ncbi:conserved hypothetical protein [Talaromyces stipitatus ATCC 10500]|uniref:Phospholipid scramblase n=1 Tax=Talaromyces stipitatus (strain ATCC 10500 / CBS 375.48 / QM 6759 / NRRL 1006) TaxID=441959 RepID=B8MJ97_TALSN|nr:uncharacterized protein TSTA_041640 [Talaromyces stipitatus ATCC 10500]EED14686.1 conserved hypothetical protein [Talaromyces stipitatus ATCC 10500]
MDGLSSKKLEHEQETYRQTADLSGPPPPAYSTVDAQDETMNTSKYPPQSYHQQAPTLTLQTENTKFLGQAMRIYDLSNPFQNIYEIKIKTLGMDLYFYRPGANQKGQEFATVKFHKLSLKMDITLPDTPMFTLKCKQGWNYKVSYPSPSFQGEMVSWKTNYHFKTMDFELRDAKGIMLARLKASNWNWKKTSQIEIFGGHVSGNQKLMDEIVVTGFGLLEYVIVMNAVTITAS